MPKARVPDRDTSMSPAARREGACPPVRRQPGHAGSWTADLVRPRQCPRGLSDPGLARTDPAAGGLVPYGRRRHDVFLFAESASVERRRQFGGGVRVGRRLRNRAGRSPGARRARLRNRGNGCLDRRCEGHSARGAGARWTGATVRRGRQSRRRRRGGCARHRSYVRRTRDRSDRGQN